MSEKNVHRDENAWDAQSLRLTVFPLDPEKSMKVDWWNKLFGADPETTVVKAVSRKSDGPFENHQLTLTADVERIQWVMSPKQPNVDIPESVPALGNLSDAITVFSSTMEHWLADCPPISRIAFGAVLLQTAESHEDGYRRLGAYLPSVKVDPKSREFHYRINRRRKSQCGIEGLEINRLSNWSVTKWSVVVGATSGAGTTLVKPRESYTCTLQLDVNSAGEFREAIPRERLHSLWLELVGLAREIAINGDVP